MKRMWRQYHNIIIYCIALCLLLTGCTANSSANNAVMQTTETAAVELDSFVGVLQSMDIEGGKMTFVEMATGTIYELIYTGGVDVRNKYDEIIAASQLEPGQVVTVEYSTASNRLKKLQVSPDAWEVQQISGLKIDKANRKITVNDTQYRYDNSLVIVSGEKVITLPELCSEDQVTVRGYNNKVCSVSVELGHGYVKLTDYDTYIGGMIEIGYGVIVPVTEDMLLTVREGEYKLKITKGEHSGYKNVVVHRDEEATVSLREIQIQPDPTGTAYFDVSPEGAQIWVDGEAIDASNTVPLTYGSHRIKVSASGYDTISGYITVQNAYKIFTVTMVKTEDSSATTTTEGTTTNTNNTTNTDSTQDAKETNNTVTIKAPVGAKVYVDGSYKGEIPVTFPKTVGSHVITLTMTGCLVQSYTVQCTDNSQDDTYSFDALATYSSVLLDE